MRISDWSSAACSSDLLVLALVAHHPASHHATSHHPAAAHHAPFGGGRSKTDRPAVTDVHNDFCAFGGRQFDAARRMRLRQKTAIACDLMEATARSEEHTSELQSLMRISYAVFCLKKTKNSTMTSIKNLTRHKYNQYHIYISNHVKRISH